jgi:pyruvate dehydrogenase E1 component alpha subunit
VESYKLKDPIEQVRAAILAEKMLTENDLEAIELRIEKVVEESVTFAENSPFPTADELFKDVYVEEDYPFIMD